MQKASSQYVENAIFLVPIHSVSYYFLQKNLEINFSSFVNCFHVFSNYQHMLLVYTTTVNSLETKILSLAKYFVKPIKCCNLLLQKLISRFFGKLVWVGFANFVRRAEDMSFFRQSKRIHLDVIYVKQIRFHILLYFLIFSFLILGPQWFVHIL